ncbi:hypothetical protein BH23GEM3_BH23GEM3_09730 [soil metagenome]
MLDEPTVDGVDRGGAGEFVRQNSLDLGCSPASVPADLEDPLDYWLGRPVWTGVWPMRTVLESGEAFAR